MRTEFSIGGLSNLRSFSSVDYFCFVFQATEFQKKFTDLEAEAKMALVQLEVMQQQQSRPKTAAARPKTPQAARPKTPQAPQVIEKKC